MIAFGLLATTATNGLPPLIPTKDGFFVTYMFCSSLMILVVILFVVGTPFYRKESLHVNTNNEPVLQLFASRLLTGRRHPLGKVALLGWACLPLTVVMALVSAFLDSWTMTIMSLVLDVFCIGCLVVAHRSNAWLGCDSVTQCLDTVPKLLVGNVIFNVLYNSMSTLFFSEACQMDTRLGSAAGATQLNGSVFNMADSIAIIVFTPIINQLCIPFAARLFRREVSLNMKIYAGIFFGVLAQLVAAAIEYSRRSANVLSTRSLCAPLDADDQHIHMSNISAFWMAIPYAMIGIGEILVNPVLQHTAYVGAPDHMRSLLQAFNLFAQGAMPNAISAVLLQATAPWVTNNLNEGKLPSAYYVVAVYGVLGCFLYYLITGSEAAKAIDDSSTRPEAATATDNSKMRGNDTDLGAESTLASS